MGFYTPKGELSSPFSQFSFSDDIVLRTLSWCPVTYLPSKASGIAVASFQRSYSLLRQTMLLSHNIWYGYNDPMTIIFCLSPAFFLSFIIFFLFFLQRISLHNSLYVFMFFYDQQSEGIKYICCNLKDLNREVFWNIEIGIKWKILLKWNWDQRIRLLWKGDQKLKTEKK